MVSSSLILLSLSPESERLKVANSEQEWKREMMMDVKRVCVVTLLSVGLMSLSAVAGDGDEMGDWPKWMVRVSADWFNGS